MTVKNTFTIESSQILTPQLCKEIVDEIGIDFTYEKKNDDDNPGQSILHIYTDDGLDETQIGQVETVISAHSPSNTDAEQATVEEATKDADKVALIAAFLDYKNNYIESPTTLEELRDNAALVRAWINALHKYQLRGV